MSEEKKCPHYTVDCIGQEVHFTTIHNCNLIEDYCGREGLNYKECRVYQLKAENEALKKNLWREYYGEVIKDVMKNNANLMLKNRELEDKIKQLKAKEGEKGY